MLHLLDNPLDGCLWVATSGSASTNITAPIGDFHGHFAILGDFHGQLRLKSVHSGKVSGDFHGLRLLFGDLHGQDREVSEGLGKTMADIIFTPSGDDAADRQVRRDYEDGKFLRIAHGVYARADSEPVENLVRRNWSMIVGKLVPGAVATDRTGMENQPWRDRSSGAPKGDGVVFVSAPRTRDVIRLPGLEIRIRQGVGVADGDMPYLGTWLAGPARRLLDNLALTRSRQEPSRTLGRAGVEAALESLCSTNGVEDLNHIRDQARALAPAIGRDREFDVLNGLISALLRTREAGLVTPQGRARAAGAPLDPDCVRRLVTLASHLQARAPVTIENRDTTQSRRASGAFIEAYFSNFIEGTEFAVDEAAEIVFEGRIPQARPEDGHDVLGAYVQLMELGARSTSALDADAFVEELRERHRRLMQARPSVQPGVFKIRSNKAGDTDFVAPDRVEGTLREGLSIFKTLKDAFSRAAFIHFLISDVHPFNDGNGRLSRIMMTKELLAGGLSRIVIPTVYRGDYLDSLRALSRRNDPKIFVRSLEFCQGVSAACSEEAADAAVQTWARAYAFCEDTRHARLTMPDRTLAIETRSGTPAPVDYWEAIGRDNGFAPAF